MVVRTSRRLPGFRFEVQSPPLTDVLPRMDVAVFVGFAASGPLHKPVAIEDFAQFTTIFGDIIPLAWDAAKGEQVYAYLAPTVRAFFRNGGRRCWVIRVASDQAQYNYFPIPGLARVDSLGKITPAFARARSEGSWSDALQVSTALLSLPVVVNQFALADQTLTLTLTSSSDVIAGDLLRLTFHHVPYILLCTVQSVKVLKLLDSSQSGPGTVRVTWDKACWLSTSLMTSPAVLPIRAILYTYTTEQTFIEEDVPFYTYAVSPDGQTVTLEMQLTSADAPAPGSFVLLTCGEDQVLVMVQEVSTGQAASSPPVAIVRISGPGQLRLKEAPALLSNELPDGERLSFELWTRAEAGSLLRMSSLTFDDRHPNFWGALPIDAQLYDTTATSSSTVPVNLWQTAPSAAARTALWQAASTPRFPLAGISEPDQQDSAFYVPVAMTAVPAWYLPVTRKIGQPRANALMRDGLASFDVSLFLDAAMADARIAELMARADFLRYQNTVPQTLQGIYAALDIEEATLIALPDAIHRRWRLDTAPTLPPGNGLPVPPVEQQGSTEKGLFATCDVRMIPAPELALLNEPDQHGTFTLFWLPGMAGQANYTLQEALDANFTTAASIYTGQEQELTLYGRQAGDYYYRVNAEVNGIFSAWSQPLHVAVNPLAGWQLLPVDTYDATTTLLPVQCALLRLCAARGDICALLTMPEHYHENQVEGHVAMLKAATVSGATVPPLGFGEAIAFSYGALYHPWLFQRDEDQLGTIRRTPPEGAVCGMIAQQAITRGAWIAPANVALVGVVDLTPVIARSSRLRMQDLQVNLIRQEPRGFLTLNADTLSDDEDLRPLHVRRLLILLRRQALQLGVNYVFEPNDDAFRRMVQRGFEEMLEQLFMRGAFAGSTPASSFEVITGGTLNTAQDMTQGRFLVELRVAPALPLTFVTVRLVLQSDGNALIVEG